MGVMHPLRLYRENRLLTQRQLASRAKVSERCINDIENCRRGWVRQDIKRKLLKALHIPFSRREEVFPSETRQEA